MSGPVVPLKRPYLSEDGKRVNIAFPPHLTYHCDSEGDRKICASNAESRQLFLVSSKSMSLASRQWKAIFDQNAVSTEEPIAFHGDDPIALTILLDIAHLRHSRIPGTLEIGKFYKLAALVERYDLAQLVQPWLSHWLTHARGLSTKTSDIEKWLFIVWVFGHRNWFERFTKTIVGSFQYFQGGELRLAPMRPFNREELPPKLYG